VLGAKLDPTATGAFLLDHFGLYCRDAAVSLPFCRACLGALGVEVLQEQPHFNAAIFGRPDSPIFWWLGEGGDCDISSSPDMENLLLTSMS
jgi:hypothetical protein